MSGQSLTVVWASCQGKQPFKPPRAFTYPRLPTSEKNNKNVIFFVSGYGGGKTYSNFCSCQVTAGPKILQFLFVSGHGGAKKYSIFCSCQVTAEPKNTPILVCVRSRRGKIIPQFLFVSSHGGASGEAAEWKFR